MREVPHIVKYMGSKRGILDFVIDNILEYSSEEQVVYDLFGGSAVVSGALRKEREVVCNDIQQYTSILGRTYLNHYDWDSYGEDVLERVVLKAEKYFDRFKKTHPDLVFDYHQELSFDDVKDIESREKELLKSTFSDKFHLFVKYFSGTYWSFEQCLWIDSIISVTKDKEYRGTPLSDLITASLMFAMSYTSQSTGHYAQYRDLTPSNLNDILFYRRKSVTALFRQKFNELKETFSDNSFEFNHSTTNLDFAELLAVHKPNSMVYADPPYQFVHYSRFYHALETLVKYDYPEVAYKGRYRTDRHQSPFCIRTEVKPAFTKMFDLIRDKNSSLILSYSNSGMITYEELVELAQKIFGSNYLITTKELNHTHSTMGRQGDKSRMVNEVLLICTPIINI